MEMIKNDKKQYFSTAEIAKILGISRQAVFKRIKEGKIKAQKVGRNFVINREDLLLDINESALSEERKREIEKVVRKAIEEYGETFKLLGKE